MSNTYTSPVTANGMGKVTKRSAPILDAAKFIDPRQDEKNPAYELFLRSQLDQEKDYPPPVPVVELVQGENIFPVMTKKSVSLWQGKQKSKKTTLLAICVSCFLRNAKVDDLIHFRSSSEGVVIWFDNEQGESYAARTMKLILSMARIDKSNRLIFCNLKPYTPDERNDIVRAAIQNTPNVELVIIDGMVDLMDDFMESKEAQQLMAEINSLVDTFNIHIAAVIHQNKSKEDKSARAHIGSIYSQKCETEFSTSIDKDKSISQVECLAARGQWFDPFKIIWEKGALPRIIQEGYSKPVNTKTSEIEEECIFIQDRIFKPLVSLTRSEAEEKINKLIGGSDKTAQRRVTLMLKKNLIEQGQDGRLRTTDKHGTNVGQ